MGDCFLLIFGTEELVQFRKQQTCQIALRAIYDPSQNAPSSYITFFQINVLLHPGCRDETQDGLKAQAITQLYCHILGQITCPVCQ